jgi:uncharacterized membrane protein
MTGAFTILDLGRVLLRPQAAFAEVAADPPSASRVFFGFALWLGLLPPLFAYAGTLRFGWLLGVAPIVVTPLTMAAISLAYFLLLLFGFLTTAWVARWMARTYDADTTPGRHFALVAMVGAPLTVGSIVHLYPHAFINVLVLVPILIWSMYLLYRGVPIVLGTDPERGMLMASALIAWLLVAWVSLLGVTVVLWSQGVGPFIGT